MNATVNLDLVYRELDAMATDGKTIPGIVDAMAKVGHRWHDTPEGETPDASAVEGVVWWAIDSVMRTLRQDPALASAMSGTGGIEVRYSRAVATGCEYVSVLYTPVVIRRSLVA